MLHVNGFITWTRADVNTAHFVHSGWLAAMYYPFALTKGVWSALPVDLYAPEVRCSSAGRTGARSVITAVLAEGRRTKSARSTFTPDNRVDVIYNGVLRRASRRPAAIARSSVCRANAFLLLFVGDLRTPRKNLGHGLAAL